jgi:hypothetical protein
VPLGGLGKAVLCDLKLMCQECGPVSGPAGRELVDKHDFSKTRQGFGKALFPKGIFQRQWDKSGAGEAAGEVPQSRLELDWTLPRIGELPFRSDPQGRQRPSGKRLPHPEQGCGSLPRARG